MADEHTATIRIRRPARVTTDERGHTVWAGEIETAELELVSTAELEQILASGHEESVSAIERVVSGEAQGVLARDPVTGHFEIISDDDLRSALREEREAGKDSTSSRPDPARRDCEGEELSLASTQTLRKMLKTGGPTPVKPARPSPSPDPKRDAGGGFDPYNSG